MSEPKADRRVRFISRPIEWMLALIVLLGVGYVYWSTVAPGLTFWDAGEFIACSAILGIPHPPGTPFFILLGRVATILIPFGEIAWRVNMVSAISNVMTAVLGSLIVFRIVRPWMREMPEGVADLLAALAGVCAAGTMAFASTVWANGTEAEVYGASMFFLLLVTWLSVVWYDAAGTRGADRLLVLVLYLTFLAIGVHMQSLMLVGPVFVAVALRDPRKLTDPLLWAVVVVALLALIHTTGFLTLTTVGLVVTGGVLLLRGGRGGARWLLPFALFTVIAVGYSTHIYIPLRSAENPAIDENDPETWESFKGFLERKQYGSESMAVRALTRRGSWKSQLITNEKMGLWRNFTEQYSDSLAAHLIFTFAGLLGLYVLFRRGIGLGVLIGLAMLIGTVGLVWYLNFSDGSMGIKEEVRNRDYFFTPGFIYYAILIGVGVGGFLEMLYGWVRENVWAAGLPLAIVGIPYLVPLATGNAGFIENLALGVVIVALLLLLGGGIVRLFPESSRSQAAVLAGGALAAFFCVQTPLEANYFSHDRSRDRIAEDYGRNILTSCEEGGLIFTNGDNDTFPLWYLQEVEGFRRDVRVINLSLLNTDWYVAQLRDREPRVRISLDDAALEALQPYVIGPNRKAVRQQDRMIEEIVKQNRWRKPVYFAITVPEQNRVGLERYLQMEGFVYRLHPEPVEKSVNTERTWELMSKEYRYNGLADPSLYKDSNTLNLLNNYVAVTYQLAMQLRQDGDLEKAAEVLEFGLGRVTCTRWEIPGTLAQIYAKLGRQDDAAETAEMILRDFGNLTDAVSYAAGVLYRAGRKERAEEVYRRALSLWPTSDALNQELFSLLYRERDDKGAQQALEDWLRAAPNSKRARQIRDQLSALPAAPAAPPAPAREKE